MSDMQLLDHLAHHAACKPDAPAFVDAASSDYLTWNQLHARVTALSAQLRMQIPARSVVMIRMPNCCEFPVAFLGALAAGCAAFPVSPETCDVEFESVARRSDAAVSIDFDDGLWRFKVIEPVKPRAGSNASETDSTEYPEISLGLLLLSSGSTGKPKIVCRSVKSLDIVCDQMCRSICISGEDCVLATVPLCHSYGLEHGLLAPVWAGATTHLVRGLDLPLIQRELQQSHITLLPAVPSVFEMLGNLCDAAGRFAKLRAAYSAGAPLPLNVANQFHNRCGIRIGQVFGATEIGSVTYSNPDDAGFNPASVGRLMPGVEVKIDGGHLHISAGSMFSGYLGDANPTVDGFYSTGDMAELDEHGNLLITGRAKLLIDIGGLKVNPIEVEDVIMQHPAVGDCVVVPVRQSETVVRLKALFTLRQADAAVSSEDLRRFVRGRLAGYKVPRLFESRADFPRTHSGKILRRAVE